jgi:hypothetical protein
MRDFDFWDDIIWEKFAAPSKIKVRHISNVHLAIKVMISK